MCWSETVTSAILSCGEQLLELAVGHHLDGLGALPPLLHEHHREQREDQITEVELRFSFHRHEVRADRELGNRGNFALNVPRVAPICVTGVMK